MHTALYQACIRRPRSQKVLSLCPNPEVLTHNGCEIIVPNSDTTWATDIHSISFKFHVYLDYILQFNKPYC